MSGPIGNLPFGIMATPSEGQGQTIGAVHEGFPTLQSHAAPSPQQGTATADQVTDSAGSSGPVVTNVENFEAMSYKEMTARVVSFTPSTAADFSTAWSQFSRSIDAATANLEADIGAGGEEGFEGLFPDTVRRTHQSFVNSSKTLSDMVASPSDKLGSFADILNTVQSRFTFLSALIGPDLPVPAVGAGFPRPSPQLTALMESTYSPAVLDAGSQLPTLPGPFHLDPGGDQATAGGASASSRRPGAPDGLDGGAPRGLAGGSTAGTSAVSTDEAAVGQSVDPSGPPLENGSVSAGTYASTGRLANDAAITQAGMSPTPDGAHASGAATAANRGAIPSGSTPPGVGAGPLASPVGGVNSADHIRGGSRSSGGAGGSRGFAGRTAGAPAAPPVSGGPAGSVKGGLPRGAVLSGISEGGTNNAMAGRRGAGGAMMGGAGRGRDQEDDAYNPAEFLTTIDNGEKVIGPLPRVVHPVIGDWGDR